MGGERFLRKRFFALLFAAIFALSLFATLSVTLNQEFTQASSSNNQLSLLRTILGILQRQVVPTLTRIENTVGQGQAQDKSVVINEHITLTGANASDLYYITVLSTAANTTYSGHATLFIYSGYDYMAVAEMYIPGGGLYLGGDPRNRDPPQTLSSYTIDASFACQSLRISVGLEPGDENPDAYPISITGVIQYRTVSNAQNIP